MEAFLTPLSNVPPSDVCTHEPRMVEVLVPGGEIGWGKDNDIRTVKNQFRHGTTTYDGTDSPETFIITKRWLQERIAIQTFAWEEFTKHRVLMQQRSP